MNSPSNAVSEEVIRCQQVARTYALKGQIEKALRLYRKAYKMHEDPNVLKEIRRLERQVNGDTEVHGLYTGPDGHATRSTSSTPQQPSRPGTPKEEELINEILSEKATYYDIVQVSRVASEEQMRKNYKRLALMLHPDKCGHPRAEEAFKALARAINTLTSIEKRAKYDAELCRPQRDIPYHHGDTEDLTAEDIFRAFFGHDLGQGQPIHRHVYTERRQPTPQQRLYALLQLLPLAVILVFIFFSNSVHYGNTQKFSWHRSAAHSVGQRSEQHAIPYFTSTAFDQQYPPESEIRASLETQIELEHFRYECSREQEELSRQVARARYYNIGDLEEILQRPRPMCTIYTKLKPKS